MFQRGKLLVEWDPAGGSVAVFSAFTRAWHRRAIAPGASLTHANDWCLIREGTRWTAFGAYAGRFASVSLSATASLVNPASQRNDSLAVVRDGARVWAFSGFDGAWEVLDAGPAALVATQRHVAVVADGQRLWARSAWLPGWRPATAAQPVLAVAADGTAGVAETGAAIHGFSAALGRWNRTATPGGAGAGRTLGDVALFERSAEVVAFSGLTGTFARVAVPPGSAAVLDRQVAAVPMGAATLLYSAVDGRWQRHATSGGGVPSLRTEASLVLLREPDRVHAFSALVGAVSTVMEVPVSVDATRALASVVGSGGQAYLYSARTGAWHPAPGSAGRPQLGAVDALLPSAVPASSSNLWAFSGRDGSFVPLQAGANALTYVDPQSAAMAAADDAMAHAFDGRTGRWVSTALSGTTPPQVAQWRTAIVLARGTRAVGFAVQAGRFEEVDLGSSPSQLVASSEVVLVDTPALRWGFGAVPEVLGAWQFPAFRRIQPAGAPLALFVRRADASMFVGVSPWAAQPWPVAAGAALWLDPATAGLWATLAPADGAAVGVPLGVLPVAPAALRGTRWVFQGLVAGSSGLRVTDPCDLELW